MRRRGARIGRNDPCPCGSGKKYKKCCLAKGARPPGAIQEILRRPSPFNSGDPVAAEIASAADIGPYLDSIVGALKIFKLPRVEALLHCLRALHMEAAGLVIRGESNDAQYHHMRRSQDLLRYLVYEIFSRCVEGGAIRPSSLDEIKLADSTIGEFAQLSRLRDLDESVKRGFADCRVDAARRVVTIFSPPTAARHACLEQERIDGLLAGEKSVDQSMDTVSEPIKSLLSTVQIDAETRSFTYEFSKEVVSACLPWAEGDWRSGQSDPLPEDWSFGPYTVGEFRTFYLLLATWTNLHSFIFATIAKSGRVLGTTAVPTPTIEEIMDFMRVHGDLDASVTSEIVRDLTYDHKEVSWTDVQYQPLLPLVDGRVALPPIVISGSNFERNLLAVVEKLPWRREAASRVKQLREQVMIDELLEEARPAEITGKPRVKLRDGHRTVGDVDLLMWDRSGQVALAVQLKWLYGPDSVHESWDHAEKYREGAEKHLGIVDHLRDNLPRVVNDHRLTGLANSAEVLAVLVTKDDEPLSGALPDGLPAVRLQDFLRLIRDSGGDVRRVHEAAEAHWKREPQLPYSEERARIQFGEYVFEIPVVLTTLKEV